MWDKNQVKNDSWQPGNGNRRRTQWADIMKSKRKKGHTGGAYYYHSPVFSTEAKNEWKYTSILPTCLYRTVLN
jgi:hypothetical protein